VCVCVVAERNDYILVLLIRLEAELWETAIPNCLLSEMATVVDEANAYFPSVSNLAARVFADVELVKRACMANGEWEELSVEEQELITDQVLIDSQVSERYSSTVENNEFPECFPVLRIKSGEKIVVDFDQNDVCVVVMHLS